MHAVCDPSSVEGQIVRADIQAQIGSCGEVRLFLARHRIAVFEGCRGIFDLPVVHKDCARDARENTCKIETMLRREATTKNMEHGIDCRVGHVVGLECKEIN